MKLYDLLRERYGAQKLEELTDRSQLTVQTVRKAMLDVGIALIAVAVLTVIFSYIFYYVFIYAASFFINIPAFDGSYDIIMTVVNNLYGVTVSYLPKLAAFGVLYHYYKKANVLYTRYDTKLYILPIMLLALFTFGTWGSMITRVVNYTLQILFGAGEIPNVMEQMAPSGFADGVVVIIFTVFVAPIAEEIIYRKMLLTPLRVLGDVPAVVVGALIFGLAHGNFDQFCYSFFGGIIFGLTAIRFGSIKYSVALHIIHNLIVTAVTYLPALSEPGGIIAAIFVFLARLGDFIVLLTYYGGPLIALLLIVTGTAKLDRVSGEDRYKKLRTVFCPTLIAGMLIMLLQFA